MRFAVVTPSFNRPAYLYETAFSVLTQKGDFEIDYFIQDGGSNESTINEIKKIESDFKAGYIPNRCRNVRFRWSSEPDGGMYEAVKHGFSKVRGDIMSWINSDDAYHPSCFLTLSQVFQKFPQVRWVTGIPNSLTPDGSRGGFDYLPWAYSQDYISKGWYQARYKDWGFHWIQQESTFWTSELWREAKGLNANYKYAADFYLWKTFALHEPLIKVFSFLGSFRVHPNQITNDSRKYESELPSFNPPPSGLKYINTLLTNYEFCKHRLLWGPNRDKILMEKFALSPSSILGQNIFYSYSDHEWNLREATIFDRNYQVPQ